MKTASTSSEYGLSPVPVCFHKWDLKNHYRLQECWREFLISIGNSTSRIQMFKEREDLGFRYNRYTNCLSSCTYVPNLPISNLKNLDSEVHKRVNNGKGRIEGRVPPLKYSCQRTPEGFRCCTTYRLPDLLVWCILISKSDSMGFLNPFVFKLWPILSWSGPTWETQCQCWCYKMLDTLTNTNVDFHLSPL